MKLAQANNVQELNELRIRVFRNTLLQELKSNASVNSERVKNIVNEIENIYSENLDIKTKIELTRSFTLISDSHLTKYVNNIILLTEKIKFYSDIINEIITYFNSESTQIDQNLKMMLNSISDSVEFLTNSLLELKQKVFLIDMEVDLIQEETQKEPSSEDNRVE